MPAFADDLIHRNQTIFVGKTVPHTVHFPDRIFHLQNKEDLTAIGRLPKEDITGVGKLPREDTEFIPI